MPYTDVTDVRTALAPGGSQDRSTAAELTGEELEDTIAEAQARIDARLKGRYTVPFPEGEVPPAVALITRDFAAYEATLRHRKGQPLVENHPVRLRFAQATALLDAIASGDAEAEETAAGDVVALSPYEGDLFPLESFDLTSPVDPVRWLG